MYVYVCPSVWVDGTYVRYPWRHETGIRSLGARINSWALGTELRSPGRAPPHLEVCLTTEQDSPAQQVFLVHSPNMIRTQEMREETEPLKPQNVSLLSGLRSKSNRNMKQSNWLLLESKIIYTSLVHCYVQILLWQSPCCMPSKTHTKGLGSNVILMILQYQQVTSAKLSFPTPPARQVKWEGAG